MASLSASALSHRSKSPELTIAATPRGFGSSGRGAPGGSGAGREHLDLEPADAADAGRRGRGTRRIPRASASASRRLKSRSVRAVGVLEQQRGRDPLEHLVQSALVVARLVGGDHQVEPAHAGRPQQAVDARLGRAAVEQRGGTGAVLDQGGIALADVEEADGEGVGRRRAWRAPRPPASTSRAAASTPTPARSERGLRRQAAASSRAPGRDATRVRTPVRARGRPRAPCRVPAAARRAAPSSPRRRQRLRPVSAAAAGGVRPGGSRSARRGRRGRRSARASADRAARRAGRCPAAAARAMPSAALTIPSHMAGATAGSASTLAASPASGTEPKWYASRGAVASVAATVIAMPSQRPSRSAAGPARGRATGAARRARQLLGDPPQPRGQRAAGHQDARDRHERELPARVAAGARVQGERGGRREQQRVPARRRSRERHRRDAGGAHHARALQRRPGARQRHVERHQAQQRDAPPARPEPGRHEQRQRERHQQHHVLPAHRQQMRETGVAPVVARGAVDLLVLAEHHAERERGVRLRQPGGDRRSGPATQAVERTRDSTTPRAGEPDALDDQLTRDAAAAQVGGEVEARVGILRGPAQRAGERELVADRRPAGEASVPSRPSKRSRTRLPASRRRRCGPRRTRRTPTARAREEVGAGRHRSPVVDQGR